MESKFASLVDVVEEQLMDHIRSKKLKPGDALPNEAVLVQELGVSRSVLREVLSRFKMVGLVSSRTRRGMVLTEPFIFEGVKRVVDANLMSDESVMNLLGFRVALEVGIAHDIMRNLTDRHVQELESIVNVGVTLGDNFYAGVSEHAFHSKLYEITGNKIIAQFQNIISPVIQFVKNNKTEYIQEINRDLEREGRIVTHRDLVALLRDRDEHGFRDAMHRHFYAYQRLVEDYNNDKL